MKKYIKILLVILAVGLIGGWIYWKQYKKRLVKDTIQNAITRGTDSLYFIHYDSSYIDEVKGNASFFNVELQSDSLKKQLLILDTASAATIFNVHIDEVTILGANISGLLSNTLVEARSILLKHPVVYIISSGKKKKNVLNGSDSLLIYEKLLGRFNSINADEIKIEEGNLFFTDKTGQPKTAFENISVQLKNFRIDSTKDYQNIVSYFIKDIVAKVTTVLIKGENNQATFSDVEYNAPGKFISIKNFQQRNKQQQLVFDINNTSVTKISTDSFILNQQLKAEELKSDGGILTFYRKGIKDSTKDEVEIDNNYFNEALVDKVTVNNTRIFIYNREKPADEPFILDNVKFKAVNIQKLHSGTSIRNLISTSNWTLSADGFSFMPANKRYKMTVGAFDINNGNSTMRVKNFSVKPVLSEAAFTKSLAYQEDLYELEIKNIELSGIDIRGLITQKRLEAETVTLQPTFKAYRDKTVAPDMSSKVGKYPQQLLQKIELPFSIKKIIVKDGTLTYREKNDNSNQTGTVFFKNINGTITNLTNIDDLMKKNNLLVLSASADFMGISQIQTTWKLPLNSANGAFVVSGSAGGFNAPLLNPIAEPLGMTSIITGKVNKLTFNLTGNDHGAKGTSVFLYEDLKIEMLKKDSGSLKKKGFMSLLTNALIKDKNPQNGEVRTGEIDYERDITKSFFNLIWKSIFSGIKKTAQKL